MKSYTYLDKAGVGFDCDGMLADLKAMPPNSALLLHACAHNPTGVDPSIATQQRDALAVLEASLPHLVERERFRFDAEYFTV